ncbi:hypothetical protein PG999_012501 [Apiospora kogelbergensis]|uniref:Uncharacterized protein n=1 Tax=Apiospora kogelbergensis TaxID=1337665 RepID=A0AAW0Q965_9PEZI
MTNRGIDTGTGRPEDYISRVETKTDPTDDGGPKMAGLRSVQSEPPPRVKARRGSLLDTFKDVLKPGDIRAAERQPKPSQGGGGEGGLLGKSTDKINNQQTGWHTKPQQPNQTGNPFDSALSGPDYHHTPGRHRSHGVMDHLLGRSRDHDDKSGIIGSRSQRADLGASKSGSTKSKGPGFASDEQNYSFETPARSREDPRRSAIDAVPRVSALDSEEAMGHEFSVCPYVFTAPLASDMDSRSQCNSTITDVNMY